MVLSVWAQGDGSALHSGGLQGVATDTQLVLSGLREPALGEGQGVPDGLTWAGSGKGEPGGGAIWGGRGHSNWALRKEQDLL